MIRVFSFKMRTLAMVCVVAACGGESPGNSDTISDSTAVSTTSTKDLAGPTTAQPATELASAAATATAVVVTPDAAIPTTVPVTPGVAIPTPVPATPGAVIPSPAPVTPGVVLPTPAPVTPGATPDPSVKVNTVTVASGLEFPWSMAFLPDGRILVTERMGQLRIVSPDGLVSKPLAGLPAVATAGQGGLLDVVLSPDFVFDQLIYFSFSEPVAGGLARTAVARAELSDGALLNMSVIFRQSPASSQTVHFGSRLVFGADGNLFVTLGERFDRDRAQQLDNHLGKVIRIRPDGSVPADNPFVAVPGVLPEIYSYGHRNPQGAALRPQCGQLWLNEHGPLGGDEVNIAVSGKNFGWPMITYGREYGSGVPIGEGTSKSGVEPPRHYWIPTSIAPSGMAFYTGTAIPAWENSVFVGAMAGRALVRLALRGNDVIAEERLLTELNDRIRDVRMSPDGHLYLLTDGVPARLLKVVASTHKTGL